MARQQRQRAGSIRAALEAKLHAPALSLRSLASQHQLSFSALQRRYAAFESARARGMSVAAALTSGCADGRGGHNRVFTAEQQSVLADIVRAATPSMTHTQIKDEARTLHTAIHTGEHQLRSVSTPLGSFDASDGWLTRFKRSNDLSSHRTAVISEPRPKEGENKEERYLNYVTEVHSAVLQYGARLVLNMDETAISKIDPPTTAVVAKNSGHAARVHTHISAPGQQITTMPCISAAGDKLQLCAVIKGKTPRCLKKITEGASAALQQVRLYYSEKGWINAAILQQWLRDVVQPYTHSAPAALILDSYNAHWTAEVQNAAAAMNLELIKVPPGATSELQPLDVQFNSTLLNARKKIWRETKQQDAWAEDTPQAAVDRQARAYEARTRQEAREAFHKAHLLPQQ